ncbi:uncharacterized protein LOC125045428 [Penaeus chinensis]|uniref:uncharacterized protein LOC125045428 n=1 Tax=Penaeus chinensis TaxID=139456 RepID=UPI001FB6F50D|nr:uncharacterized protein LOC125045428 [Penaeus chinensis]
MDLETVKLASLMAVALVAGGVAERTPSINYIQSPSGNFFRAPGKTIPPENVIQTLPASNACTCKNFCFVSLACLAWSLVNFADGTSECRITDAGPLSYEVENNTQATYFFKEAAVDGTYHIDVDRLLYLKPSIGANFLTAKQHCEKIPGHRLGIYKTMQQYNMLGAYTTTTVTIESLYMDLVKVGMDLYWGDGTLYNDTEIGRNVDVRDFIKPERYIMMFWDSFVSDGRPSDIRQFMCQANPLGIEW